ncbi:splicing factor, partial [Perkinsus olseni]
MPTSPSPRRSSSRGSSRSRSRSYSRDNRRYEKRDEPSRSRSRDAARGGDGGGERPREEGSYNEGESSSLIVRNLNYDTSPQHVRSLFSRYGEIRDVYLPLDYNTGRP